MASAEICTRPMAVRMGALSLLLVCGGALAQVPRVTPHQLRAWQAQLDALPASEQARVRQALRDYQQMPEAQQQQLRRQFEQLDQLHRDGWRLGPRLGRYWPGLQPLVGYLPQVQRQPMLELLRGLDELALEHLVRLAERTPPSGRQQLREQLLALPPAQRASWLAERAGP